MSAPPRRNRPAHALAHTMTVAGLMSGTSADGIDAAIVRIEPRGGEPSLTLLGHASFPFDRRLRQAVLDAMNAPSIATAELALPQPEIKGAERRALAVWVTRRGELAPVQATGGWLP